MTIQQSERLHGMARSRPNVRLPLTSASAGEDDYSYPTTFALLVYLALRLAPAVGLMTLGILGLIAFY